MARFFVCCVKEDLDFWEVALNNITARWKEVSVRDFAFGISENFLSGQENSKSWWQKVLTEIDSCDVFIYVLSRTSETTNYCKAELDEAQRLNKLILLAAKYGITIPKHLTTVPKVEVRDDASDIENGLRLLSKLPQAKMPPVSPIPTPPPV